MAVPRDPTVYDSTQFVARIRDFVNKGYGFVPMVGSGLSAPSGILMGQDFTEFLAYTMYLVLCPPAERNIARFPKTDAQWDIGTDGWPNYPNATEMREVKKWLMGQFESTCSNHGFKLVKAGESIIDVVKVEVADLKNLGPSELLSSLSRPFVPELLQSDHTGSADSISRRLFKAIYRSGHVRSLPALKGMSPSSQQFVLEEGVCSLYDWRATLAFLSRVRLSDPDEHERRKLILEEESDPAIRDSFNIHITSGKRFNLGHKMLAHLARPMRIRTILTTNFDDLIEGAFEKIHKPLESHSVSYVGGLPDPRTIRAEDSIVHLHGTQLETRADYSLDEEPTAEDKQCFTRYLLGPGKTFDKGEQKEHQKVVSSHLIVLGFSASDHRCNQMMKHLLDSDPNVRIFWVCFNDNDIAKVHKRFSEDDYHARILLHKTDRPDLLLYELYQHLTFCMPGGGFAYEFTHNVPPRRLESTKVANDSPSVTDLRNALKPNIAVDILELGKLLRSVEADPLRSAKNHAREAVSFELADSVVESVISRKVAALRGGLRHFVRLGNKLDEGTVSECQKEESNLLVVDVASGAASSLGIAFRILMEKHSKHCLWLELQDYPNAMTAIEIIFQIIAIRLGRFQLGKVPLMPLVKMKPSGDPQQIEEEEFEKLQYHYKRLLDDFHQDPSEWVVFLYGRNGPGACSGWENSNWDEVEHVNLERLIEMLGKVGIKVVYAPLTKQRMKRDQEKKLALIGSETEEGVLRCIEIFYGVKADKTGGDVVEAAFAYATNQDDEEKRFVTDAIFPFEEKHCHELKNDDETPFSPNFPMHTELSIYEDLISEVAEKWLMVSAEGRLREPHKEYENKIRFLYTLTLFRQSRHPSAFFSEAVYACPFRFNISGIDNDWSRGETVKKWMAELRDLQVLYQKSGGYCWKHRDVRLGIQFLLQKLPLFKIKDKMGEEVFPYNFLLEARSRYHYWISDWYFKAFATTGHYMPVIECLYHGFQCAKHAHIASPRRRLGLTGDSLSYHRLIRFRSAIQAMTKLLYLSRTWLKFWRASPNSHPMFAKSSGITNRLKLFHDAIAIGAGDSSVEPLAESNRQLIEDFEVARIEIGCALQNEAIGVSRIDIHSSSRRAGYSRPDTIQIDINSEVIGSDQWDEPFKEECRKFSWEGLVNALSKVDTRPQENIRQEAIQPLHDGIEEFLHGKTHNSGRIEEGWLRSNCIDDKELFKFIDALTKFASLHKLRAKMEFHGKERDSDDVRLHHPTQWIKVTALCSVALDMTRYLSTAYLDDEIEARYHLHSSYAIALANLDRFYEAHRHLNEALALLSKSSHPTNESHTVLGIIRLRRAEVYLTESLRLKNVLDKQHEPMKAILQHRAGDRGGLSLGQQTTTETLISDWQGSIFGEPGSKQYTKLVNSRSEEAELQWEDISINPVVNSFIDGSAHSIEKIIEIQENLDRRHTACLDDAYNELEMASKLLTGKSQSTYWWGTYLAIKLRIYGAHFEYSKFDALVYRRRIEHGSHVVNLLNRGLLLFPNNPYEGLRAIDYFIDAWTIVSKKNFTKGRGLTETTKNNINYCLEQYGLQLQQYPSKDGKRHLVGRYYEIVKKKRDGVV